ncbi:hypothetical protein LCGC14_1593080 [marine sediment metagenome]|uniref:Glycosyl transferase family 1 domain-containing protein n=1 Tax=marine sediment metagenome TaxID=412755 RepID=A0A0F9IDV2_9ZZZZ
MKILHITPHLGGGVGSTILGYLSKNKSFEHEIASFGYTMDYVLEKIESLKIPYTDHITHEELIKKIPNFDIVLIHQWNSPLLMDFLVRNELPPCRLVMLGHNSGFDAPNIYTEKILMYPDIFVFTTALSYHCYDVKRLPHIFSGSIGGALEITTERHLRNKIIYNIWSTDGVEEYKDIERKDGHKGFNIGYIGTVDYAKLHPDFLEMCKEIIDLDIIPHLKFIVIGGLKQEEIESEAKEMGIADKFEFTGYVPKETLKNYLESFDVFGYPLAPYHYGTCDLVLQIAMAAGVVPIVFNNAMEKLFIKNNKTGIIVKDKKEYVQAIENMYKNINWRKELGKNAKEDAIKRFTLENLNNEWEKVFKKVLEYRKVSRKWDINKKEITYKDVFLESLGKYAKPFIVEEENRETIKDVIKKMESETDKAVQILIESGTREIKELAKIPSWQTDTKGSVHNYHSYFPDDPNLSKWSKLMKSELK